MKELVSFQISAQKEEVEEDAINVYMPLVSCLLRCITM